MLKTSQISFPGLGIEPFSLDSVAFRIGDFSVAYYGVIITFGIILAVLYVMWRARQVGISGDTILDIALLVVPMGVVGARLYYVLTSLDQFDSFADVFNIRGGGLAIYGGIIGGALAVIIMAHFKKISFFKLADMITPAVLIGQILGRWGNFFNAEAYGSATTLPWRMGLFKGGEWIFVHPTFLYESLWNLLGFILINLFYGLKPEKTHKKYDGQIFLMVFAWYGFGRMLIEGLRTDSLYVGPFRISQVLGLVFFVLGAALLLYHHFTKTDMLFRKIGTHKEGEK
ncbi:MAG: prolipoprotein diacylglyceryl transferase [Clostridia bacterium]|nr:prolipoprotein diacylglyceryl transferase [Clostridia bacterium]